MSLGDSCANPESFARGGSNYDKVFCLFVCFGFFDEGREDPNSTKSGPSSTASETPFK